MSQFIRKNKIFISSVALLAGLLVMSSALAADHEARETERNKHLNTDTSMDANRSDNTPTRVVTSPQPERATVSTPNETSISAPTQQIINAPRIHSRDSEEWEDD